MPLQASFWRGNRTTLPEPTKIVPFAGRIGANQEFSVDKHSCAQKELLQEFPDAAPWIPLRDALSLRNILQRELWKGAVVEAIGTCLLAYLTCFVAIGLGNVVKSFQSGALVPSLLGGVIAMFTLPLFIFAAGPVSGAHLNPTITMATFFGRLATLSRCILYIAFQTFGGAIAGWLLRASFNTRSFVVPGCYLDLSKVSLGSAFAIEFTTDLALIFLSFGVGLDPRQREVFGPALGPIFVGIVLGVCTFMTGFSVPGYTGFSGNPARCFAAMVGSHFVSYHWIHWIGPLAAAIAHGVIYQLVPPYSRERMASDGESTA
ncbi:aquaporin-like protein [Aspergillus pseudocaelatus]|uniref:Aquaporin-like protein n=1 Tax=Aspergillus pseudocaelatus TaxID=1825620 RepID=A0ABQ6W8P9_9EURO|nr:aquaporin-like protein [Aspergillus pseudocaelatus]